ncbi:MAG: serine hydrolase domain-containing protein [Pseudomonadota bacterium]
MRHLILAATIAVAAAAPATAQTAMGEWRGTLTPAPGTNLRIAIHIQKAEEGPGLVGTLDSLDQGAMGIALGDIAPAGDRLTFTVPSIGGKYDGKWAATTGSWVGTFTQGPLPMALTLSAHTMAPSTPLALPANWKIDPATATPLLDALVTGRAGISAAAGLVDRNRIDVRTSTGAKADALYEIGSITKLFTALLLADMAAKGEVKLDDPVAKYLPAGTLAAHGNRPITLRDLAGHYSGLSRLPANLSFKDMSDPYADFDEASLLSFLKGWTPSRAPGAMFEYSNLGAGLLGYALGRAGGKPYDQLLGDRILRPLGMSATRVAIGAGEAVPHGADGKAVKPWNLGVLVAAGGLRSSAGDMAKFTRALIDPPAPLKPAVAMLLRDVRPGGGTQTKIGLGLFTRTTTAGMIAFHDGGTGGSRSSLVIDPKQKRGAIVLINSAAEPGPGPLSLHFATGRPLPTKP